MAYEETKTEVVTAFLEACKEIKNPTKNSTNPHFKNKYANLEQVIECAKDVLLKHGIVVIQGCEIRREGIILDVDTQFLHVSGKSLHVNVAVPIGKMDPQGGMGAFTYGRRYGLLAALNLAAEDDDGNSAMPDPAKKEEKTTAPNPNAIKSNIGLLLGKK